MPLEPRKSAGAWALCLLLPFVALLVPSIYNAKDPVLFGFPFFYWYQFAWVPLTSGLIFLVYRRIR